MSIDNVRLCPPMPPQIASDGTGGSTTTTTTTTAPFVKRNKVLLPECKWASAYPELQKACYLSRVCMTISPKACRLKCVRPILQEGPTCGLAALSMLTDGDPSAEELLYQARRSNFTRNGEMFSARNLFELVDSVLNDGNNKNGIASDRCRQHGIKARLYEGRIYSETIKQVLLDGGCLLVPYPFIVAKIFFSVNIQTQTNYKKKVINHRRRHEI